MKIESINKKSVKQISNVELVSLHRRIHQLYTLAKQRNSKDSIKLLKEKHEIIVTEMLRRKLQHFSPLE